MATWSDRGAELWGFWGFVGNTCSSSEDDSPYPVPNANSPRVRYTDLELDSDLTLGNGDNKIGSGTTIGLGMGMSDLGEPPVSAGFTEEVALSRRGCSFVKLLRSMVLVLTFWCWWKSESLLLVNYANPVVPSGSQQADRWQDVFL